METIIEIVHPASIKPVLRVEFICYLMLVIITVSLGIVHALIKR